MCPRRHVSIQNIPLVEFLMVTGTGLPMGKWKMGFSSCLQSRPMWDKHLGFVRLKSSLDLEKVKETGTGPGDLPVK